MNLDYEYSLIWVIHNIWMDYVIQQPSIQNTKDSLFK